MKTLLRIEAASLLGISLSTLQRRVRAGRYTCTRLGSGQFAKTVFTYAGIGLPEPEPVPEPEPAPVPEPQPASTPEPESQSVVMELSDAERRIVEDLRFAERYKAGEATDSAGNRIDGNERFPNFGKVSLLGPMERQATVRPSTTAHMDERLLPDTSAAPNPIDSDDYQELIHPGHKERKAAMYASCGLRQPTEQERKQALDIAAIHAAFRRGYVR